MTTQAMWRRGLSLALGAVLIGCSPAHRDGGAPEGTAVPESSSLDSLLAGIARVAEEGRFSGAIRVVKDGRTVLEGAYGLADRESGTPNTLDTRFNLGSIGKAFTAIAIAQLAEAGLVDLSAPVGRYVPRLPARIGDEVRIEHLLTHTSGLHDFFSDPRYPRLKDSLTSVEAYRPLILADRPEFKPGSRFLYSNTGYALLGLVVEAVSGQDFYSYVERNLFEAAGMRDSGYEPRDNPDPGRATGYTLRGGELEPTTATLPPRGSPAGGVYSTVADMGRFADALWAHRLLGPEFTTLVTTPKVDEPDGSYGYGFGIRQGPEGDPPTIWHNGGAPGVGAELAMNPGLGYTVVILSNYDYRVMIPVVDMVLDTLRIP